MDMTDTQDYLFLRDEGVKKACAKMVATKWIQQADDNLIEFLQRLDVMSSDVADDVLRAFFDYRADIIGNLTFDGKDRIRYTIIQTSRSTTLTFVFLFLAKTYFGLISQWKALFWSERMQNFAAARMTIFSLKRPFQRSPDMHFISRNTVI